MVSVEEAVNTSSSDGEKNQINNNPFERLQPPLRSEEDEIRKGIFGQALRLLHTATDEVKLHWRRAIEEAIAARQPTLRRNKKAALVAEEAGEATLLVTSAAVKRSRDDDKGWEVDAEDVEKIGKTEGGEGGETRSGGETSTDRSGCHTTAEDSQVDNTEFIAAYLRTLLDKVVGLSLLELHIEALRVLCVMLGIPPPKSRSKMTFYSTLASFYYTHCEKLGKRVSSSHNLQAQLKRDEQMVRKLCSTGSTSQAISGARRSRAAGATATAAPPPDTTGKVNIAALSSDDKSGDNHRKNARTMPTSGDGIASTIDGTSRTRRRKFTLDAAAEARNKTFMEEEEDAPAEGEGELELEVRHNGNVFASAAAVHQAMATPKNNDDDEEEEWTMTQLEKKVASVVQLYDPVTSAVVVKKLAQMGYRKPCAMETVEAILRSFHQRELVFYDSGIAYLL
ncbi:hypothetical protein TraAM80_00631 [Trypanosoma rangeli]|uniref:Uncharacterized protein n=1 Tax=Trypanosoma rangeli TaxID=5698 RepID=A0A3S5ISL0_TRYRA|nr:uncharacterized protein TraAM80_00631 [Trypanosoma rangeli]RNF11936.1 hypothetical protein TraAM80_00631 [Trypanosoma rangeli]|eukprot:RNF11936.1 hypothetical protein TraAM80_00631 [Trypanosoma rangeli]